jgi:hypothetical protein
MKAIFANPRKAGYMLEDKDLYQPHSYKTITVDSSITDIASFAEANGVLYKHIKCSMFGCVQLLFRIKEKSLMKLRFCNRF